MKIGLCQLNSVWENKEQTKARIINLINASMEHVDCLVFPEMTLTGFSMNQNLTSLSREDHSFFENIAKAKNTIVIYGGVENNLNCVFIVTPKTPFKKVYEKKHLFSYAGESKFYKNGDYSEIIEIQKLQLSFAICYDLRFPYQFWELASRVHVFIVIANWPEPRREHWLTLLRARAIENLSYVIGVNRVGSDPKNYYVGDSSVYGPFGEPILKCGSEEGVYLCDIDLTNVLEIRREYQFFKDRKTK